MRVIIVNLFLFLLPFIGYGLYVFYRKGHIDTEEALRGKAFFWLIGGGIACVIIGLAALATFQSGSPDAVYVPARYENGVLIPGGFVQPDEAENPTESDKSDPPK